MSSESDKYRLHTIKGKTKIKDTYSPLYLLYEKN